MRCICFAMLRALLVVLALAAAACAPSPDRRRGTVIFASGADLQSMNPLVTTHPLARQVQRYVLLTTLVRRDSAMRIEPYLATSWQWTPDRRRLTMTIHPSLHWHDGVRTTARDAQWTIEAAHDPVTGYPRLGELSQVRRVDAPDDTTLVVEFTDPQDGIPDVFTDLAVLPRHHLATVPRGSMREAAWNAAPIGNGPYRFVRHEPNRRWVFEADTSFPAELGGAPGVRRLVIAVVDEPTTKLAALASGELDFAGINPAHAAFVQRNPRLVVLDYPLLFTYVLVFNTRRAPFDDVRVRRAIAAAIDRRAIVDGYLFGYAVPGGSPIPPPLPGATAAVAPPDTSARFSGVGFELLTVGSGDAPLEQMLQSQLARIGIVVTIRQLEMASFLDRVHGSRHDFEAAVMGVSGDIGMRHLGSLLELAGGDTVGTSGVIDRIVDSIPLTILYHARGVQGANRRVRGVRMDMRGELATLRDWRVE
jgi:peptide/nickel transport system substrate-binding protein